MGKYLQHETNTLTYHLSRWGVKSITRLHHIRCEWLRFNMTACLLHMTGPMVWLGTRSTIDCGGREWSAALHVPSVAGAISEGNVWIFVSTACQKSLSATHDPRLPSTGKSYCLPHVLPLLRPTYRPFMIWLGRLRIRAFRTLVQYVAGTHL